MDDGLRHVKRYDELRHVKRYDELQYVKRYDELHAYVMLYDAVYGGSLFSLS